MKKIIIALITLALVSCGKQNTENEKTYTFTDNFGETQAVTFPYPENSSVAFILSEYRGKWKICENRIDNPPEGKTYSFIASEEAEYVTVRIHVVYRGKPSDSYMPERFYLTGGKTTNIIYRIREGTGSTGNVLEEPVSD